MGTDMDRAVGRFQGGNKFRPGNLQGRPIKHYRCVFCKRIIGTDSTKLLSHEAQCDARFIVKRQWATAIDKAIRREKKLKGGKGG